jgi:hypothetical protein
MKPRETHTYMHKEANARLAEWLKW